MEEVDVIGMAWGVDFVEVEETGVPLFFLDECGGFFLGVSGHAAEVDDACRGEELDAVVFLFDAV